MTIKHLLYTQLCAFMYTKGACVVFFRFWNSPMKIFYVIETVASISDQREYDLGVDTTTFVLLHLHSRRYTRLTRTKPVAMKNLVSSYDLVSWHACQSCNFMWVGLKRIGYIANMTHLIAIGEACAMNLVD